MILSTRNNWKWGHLQKGISASDCLNRRQGYYRQCYKQKRSLFFKRNSSFFQLERILRPARRNNLAEVSHVVNGKTKKRKQGQSWLSLQERNPACTAEQGGIFLSCLRRKSDSQTGRLQNLSFCPSKRRGLPYTL